MRRAAALVETWRAEGRHGAIARPVDTDGLGPRADDDVLLVDAEGRSAGALFAGTVSAPAVEAGRAVLAGGPPHQLVLTVDIDDDRATAAGLTCGGRASIVVQRLDDIADEWWDAVAAGRPAALVSRLDPAGATLVVRPGQTRVGTLGGAELDALAEAEAAPVLAHPGPSARRVLVGDVELLVESWNPVPHLVIVGAAALSEALTRQVELLGWQASTTTTAADSLAAIERLSAADMVVVLDHHNTVGTPALAAALRQGVGYVGALGSRRTQESRRRALGSAGVTDVELEAMHGPTGLDLGATTAAETAVSIVAEILAVRSGRAASPLRESRGSIRA